MADGGVIVLDVGKSLAKLTFWDVHGALVARHTRPNAAVRTAAYRALDVDGIEAWVAATLASMAALGPVDAIIPVAHGAAGAVVGRHGLAVPPIDYEDEMPADWRTAYDRERDPFQATGSPALPGGLNLGAQLFRLERENPALWQDGHVLVTWPQYWAWRFCGVAATEVSSLGCHTDLWLPAAGQPSDLAKRRGWADRLAPLRGAGEQLARLSDEWRQRTGLTGECRILCGLHDSNAALLAARGHAALAGRDMTVLSTGTWFIAMRSPAPDVRVGMAMLDADRDCLMNVDIAGCLVPSARFMGGREAELLAAVDGRFVDVRAGAEDLRDAAQRLAGQGAMILPSWVAGVGPYPARRGHWVGDEPEDALTRRALTGLYLALMADTSLGLIGSRDCLLVEGRFADDPVFTGALAALRPDQKIYVSHAQNAVPFGALRLLRPELTPPDPLHPVQPLDGDFAAYAEEWRAMAAQETA